MCSLWSCCRYRGFRFVGRDRLQKWMETRSIYIARPSGRTVTHTQNLQGRRMASRRVWARLMVFICGRSLCKGVILERLGSLGAGTASELSKRGLARRWRPCIPMSRLCRRGRFWLKFLVLGQQFGHRLLGTSFQAVCMFDSTCCLVGHRSSCLSWRMCPLEIRRRARRGFPLTAGWCCSMCSAFP